MLSPTVDARDSCFISERSFPEEEKMRLLVHLYVNVVIDPLGEGVGILVLGRGVTRRERPVQTAGLAARTVMLAA